MKNVLFNQFIEKYVDEKVDLLATETFKIALLNSDYEINKEEHLDFYGLLQNYNCEIYDENESYVSGGKYIRFTQMGDENSNDGKKQFTIPDKIIWTNMYVLDNGPAKAIIYRESDGLLIAAYNFNEPLLPRNDDIILNWVGAAVITLSSEYIDGIVIDTQLDTESGRAVQNTTLTEVFRQMGTIFTNDGKGIPTVKHGEEWLNDLTIVTMISHDDVNNIFDEVMGN